MSDFRRSSERLRAWRKDWTHAAQDLSLAELAALIRLLTLAETAILGWGCGSVSPVIWLFPVYVRSEGAAEDTLADWVLRHTSNGYLPYGTNNCGAKSVAELRAARVVSNQMRVAGGRAESDRQEEARVRRSARATRNIFAAIRRGDALAVQALLDQGANLSARNQDGITPLEYAVRLGLETIIELRCAFPSVKILAVSGAGRGGPGSFLAMAGHLGASRTFAKPLNLPEFLDGVRETIDRS